MKIGGRITIKLSFVLQLLDDFTDQPVLNALFKNGSGMDCIPIRKPDGYYVFLSKPEDNKLMIISPQYNTETIGLADEDVSKTVRNVRLKPGKSYHLPEGTTCLWGKAPAGSRIGVVIDNYDTGWKLLYDYDKKKQPDQIELFNPGGRDLEERWFLLADYDSGCREFFRVKQYLQTDSRCILAEPLSSNHKKPTTRVFSFHYTTADEQGEYFLPINERIKGQAACCFYNGDCEIKGALNAGCMNRMDF